MNGNAGLAVFVLWLIGLVCAIAFYALIAMALWKFVFGG